MSDETEYRELTAEDLAYRWRERTLLESVDEAIDVAGETEECSTPERALEYLLRCSWDELEMARRRALNGKWSIECGHQVAVIVGLTRLVGPTDWENIPVDLILDGVYERIHQKIGVPTPLSKEDRRRAQAVKDRW